jgi:mannose-6-phosphate isomerase-like protein (cupin superfamily)
MDEAKTIVDNDTYQIRDLNLYDTRGKIMFTMSLTILKIGKQTKGHSHADNSEVYEFTEGSGLMLIDSTAVSVKAGDYIFVERGRFHKVINISQASDLIFRCYFAGEIRRPHLKF